MKERSEENLQNQGPDEFRMFGEIGKLEINNLLWRWLPSGTTIREADAIACKIFEMIESMWKKTTE